MKSLFHLISKSGILSGILSALFTLAPSGTFAYASNADYESSASAALSPSEKVIKGFVLDETGVAVIGAGVVRKDKPTVGAVTDLKGEFTMTVPIGATLVVSYIGYVDAEFTVGSGSDYTVTLHQNINNLDEVVVVGYGSQKKVNLTGAVSSISDASINNTVNSSIIPKLQGKVPGLNIRLNSGQPGATEMNINVRGLGTPLIVIDGIIRESMDLHRINPEDVEDISVLKDAAAAIYGMNATNGVIIITTKQGKEGKTRFRFSSNFGISEPTDVVKMCNAAQFYELRNEANVNYGLPAYISQDELSLWQAGGTGYESTDYYNETMKKFATHQEYGLSAEGGSEKVSYYFDLNYLDDEGLLRSNDMWYNKLNFRSNITAKLTRDITARVNVSAYKTNQYSPVSGIFSIWRGIVSQLPYKRAYANDNKDYYQRLEDGQAKNPVVLADADATGYSKNEDTNVNTNFELTYAPEWLKGFNVKGVVSYDAVFNESKSLSKKYAVYDYEVDSDSYSPTYFNSPTSIGNSFNNRRRITYQAIANYSTAIADVHHISATVALEAVNYHQTWLNVGKYYDFFSSDQVDYAGEENATSGGNTTNTKNISFLGRFNYDYKGKYLIEFAGRYNGSYRYDPSVRWGFFPVVSGGWRMSEEPFIKDNVSWLSNLKIRGSYGVIGEDAGSAFQYISAFTTGGGKYEFTDGKMTDGLNSPALVNKDLTWTKNKMSNIGVDFGFLDSKLAMSFDLFRRDKTGILAYRSVSLPNTFGADFPQENLNSNRTQGYEISGSYQDVIGDFSWKLTANLTWSRTMNRYIEGSSTYQSDWDRWRGDNTNRWSDVVWGYKVIGQFQNQEEINNYALYNTTEGNKYVLPGDWKYEDVNKDGVIDGSDTVPISYGETPHFNYGLGIDLTWKNFDMSVLLQGQGGFSAQYSHAYTTMFWQEANLPAYFYDRWHYSDAYDVQNSQWVSGAWPAMRTTSDANQSGIYWTSNAWRKSCTYLRIKNLSLGYTFNQSLVRKAGLSSLRVFCDITNLYTFCNKYIKPFDPESLAGGDNAGWIYPLQKSYNFGFSFNF